jgi:signal transduction histidine kinase/HD-like signal output (HDOD) protein
LDDLPTLPAIAVKLLSATLDPNSSAQEISNLLRGDQSTSAKLLSLANSAKYAQSQPAATVETAVARLGMNTLRAVVLGTKVFECFGPGEADTLGFDRIEFWKHAFGVGAAAQRIAAETPHLGVPPGEAFVGGLLHDLGKVALDAVFPKAYARVAAMAAESHGDIAEAERRVLGVDHTIAGRHLAERWNLPQQFTEVIWLHHLAADALPETIGSRSLIAIVQLADALVRELRIGNSGNYVLMEPAEHAFERLGVAASTLERVSETLGQDVAEWSALLGLDSETPEGVYLRALSRANTELSRLYDEVLRNNRRLATGARYFRAIGTLDTKLGPRADTMAVVHAICECVSPALQRPRLAAFAWRSGAQLIDLGWLTDVDHHSQVITQKMPAELAEWCAEPGDAATTVVTQVPAALGQLVLGAQVRLGEGQLWLLPIVYGQRVIGGIVFASTADERQRLGGEAEDLRSLLASLALALTRAEIHTAARRLSDDLAENNRRLQQVQAELLRSRTLASIAEMAAGAGHELNGPLAVISGRAQMLQRRAPDDEVSDNLQLVIDKASEASQIVKDLMDFAKPRPLDCRAVQLKPFLEQLREKWLGEFNISAARLRVDVSPGLPVVSADAEQLKIVFRELVRNALEATAQNEGVITVAVRPAVSEAYVEVAVQDTGYGMAPPVMQRAFDPFYSHRPAGRARGLGLPRAYRIVDSHGGKMWLESRLGDGTVVHFLLPVLGARPDGTRTSPDLTPATPTVLM